MRHLPLDYLFAGLLAIGTTAAGYLSADRIAATQELRKIAHASALRFNLGEEHYTIRSPSGCLGSLTVKAGGDSVIGVFIDGMVRLERAGRTLPATLTSSFAINPLHQLYEATVSINLAQQNIGELKLKNVRPYEISVSGFSLPATRPLVFSVPGPVTVRPEKTKGEFSILPPDSVYIPTQLPALTSLINHLEISATRDTTGSRGCDAESALNLDELEARLKSLIPKGLNS